MNGVTRETAINLDEKEEGKEAVNGVTRETAINLDENEDGKEAVTGQLSEEVNVGNVLWVKLEESSWWPGQKNSNDSMSVSSTLEQVVDENTVSDKNKPSSKTSINDVLVRLYGSYNYMYADVHKSLAEFKNILTENNFSHIDIMKNTLEQDLSSLNSGRSRRQRPKSKVEPGAALTGLSEKDASSQKTVSRKKRKQEIQNANKTQPETPKVKVKSKSQKLDAVVHNNGESSTPNNVSMRRTKIMQSLGLIAPLGSPFPRDGLMPPSSAIR